MKMPSTYSLIPINESRGSGTNRSQSGQCKQITMLCMRVHISAFPHHLRASALILLCCSVVALLKHISLMTGASPNCGYTLLQNDARQHTC